MIMTKQVFRLLDKMKSNKSTALHLEAKTAFDSFNWNYLYLILGIFGFNNMMIGHLKTLYKSPSGTIKINGNFSDTIWLERDCHQRCSVSVALFTLFLLSLSNRPLDNKDISGIMVTMLLWFGCQWNVSYINTVRKQFTQNVVLSQGIWFLLNLEKTQSISFNYLPLHSIHKMAEFNWINNCIKYLGVQIPKDMSWIKFRAWKGWQRLAADKCKKKILGKLDVYVNQKSLNVYNLIVMCLFFGLFLLYFICLKQWLSTYFGMCHKFLVTPDIQNF